MFDYCDLLTQTREVVQTWGEILREAFHEQHAQDSDDPENIDVRIEHALFDFVQELTPDFGFAAEECPELMTRPKNGETRFWLVDPHDGTRPYQEGYRGSSISVALIEDGRPVLGIVYAPAGRCGWGDYFEWCQGGHFRRNGLYVQWQSALPIALVSNKAELRHDAYEAFCAPLRYQPVPGIAYRLALAAAGQGSLAYSVGRPRDLDLAGGHALLIGAGLELYDHLGQPIRYPFPGDAERQRSWVVGGALAQTLAPFGTDLSVNKAPRQEPQWMLAPRTDALCSDPHLLNRYEGALVGCLIADAITLNTDFLDDIENEPWTTDLGAFGEVSKALVKNLRSQVDRSHEGIELLDERDGLISVFPRLICDTREGFLEWLQAQSDDVQRFGRWLNLRMMSADGVEVDELFAELENSVNGAVSFVDGLRMAVADGLNDRRLLWIAAILGARFGRNGLPEPLVACVCTCRHHAADPFAVMTRPTILLDRLLSSKSR